LKLSQAIDIESDENVNPVCLLSGVTNFLGKICYVTGWGSLNSRRSKPAILQELLLPIVNQETCALAYFWVNRISNKMICAGIARGGKDACDGDSGGPLVCNINKKWNLVGITSWGDQKVCGKPGSPGVYTRVTQFQKWIASKIASN